MATVLAAIGIPAKRRGRSAAVIDLPSPLPPIAADVLVWPDNRCYTGSPSAEIHTLGCDVVLSAIITRLIDAGARMAEPGEFTLRAFLSGRLDLTQAEAVLGVIDASGDASLDAALTQLAGNLSRPLRSVRDDLMNLIADVEAGLDFVDEDIEFVTDADVIDRLKRAGDCVTNALERLTQRGESTSAATVVLRGYPNAGKSRLFNRLVGRDAAIVTPTAGTTRDRLVATASIGDHVVRVIDTAGIEDDGDTLVTAMNRQSNEADAESQLRLWCVDGSSADAAVQWSQLQTRSRRDAKATTLDRFVLTKSDLASPTDSVEFTATRSHQPTPPIRINVVHPEGIDALIAMLCQWLDERSGDASPIGTATRSRDTLRRAAEHLSNATVATIDGAGHEIVAAEIRTAIDAIAEVTGAVYTDDILGRIFSRFCVGK